VNPKGSLIMDFYIGQIVLFAGNFAPRNWMTCAGQLLQISSNPALFSLVGTTYGGDGVHTFALPNLPAPAGAVEYGPTYQICVDGAFPPRQ
jgi:microcystin-dependent protein